MTTSNEYRPESSLECMFTSVAAIINCGVFGISLNSCKILIFKIYNIIFLVFSIFEKYNKNNNQLKEKLTIVNKYFRRN